jgi:shikimate kinase
MLVFEAALSSMILATDMAALLDGRRGAGLQMQGGNDEGPDATPRFVKPAARITGMNPAANLILVGPMGAGKTTIGRHLAARFGLRMVDADQEIERDAGATVAQIFDGEGEAGFRARERTMLASLLRHDGIVLATGGGSILDADNRALMRARGFVVHLHASVEQQLQRLAGDATRPLLARPDREQVLRELAAARAPWYAEVADLAFDTAGRDVDDAAAHLATLLSRHWQRTGAVA